MKVTSDLMWQVNLVVKTHLKSTKVHTHPLSRCYFGLEAQFVYQVNKDPFKLDPGDT